MPLDDLLIHRAGPICTLTMNRPKVMNALNADLVLSLVNALEDLSSEREIRVLVLQGSGGHFSAGADMDLLQQDLDALEYLKMMKVVGRLIRTMREMPQPIITRIRGAAYGLGSNLALAGDFAVACDQARFCEVFIHIGVIMDGGGTFFLPRLVGTAKAREIAMLGREFSGAELAARGLIYKSVPDEDLDAQVASVAQKLANRSQEALALIKAGLEACWTMNLKGILDWEAGRQLIILRGQVYV